MNWAPKRFWTAAAVEKLPGGYTVRLDARPVSTPGRAPLIVPTLRMARAIAAEWDAQRGTVDPQTMPVTRAANSAIDKVLPQRAEVAALIAAYGGSDLLCYRATGPAALVARQRAAWDPLIAWCADTLGAPLACTAGVMPQEQPQRTLVAFARHVDAFGPFELTALHDLVALSGSLVIGLAATSGFLPPEKLWPLSRIDEDWQVEQWGADEEAGATAVLKRDAFIAAHIFFSLCND